jgi:hypothetical protein
MTSMILKALYDVSSGTQERSGAMHIASSLLSGPIVGQVAQPTGTPWILGTLLIGLLALASATLIWFSARTLRRLVPVRVRKK